MTRRVLGHHLIIERFHAARITDLAVLALQRAAARRRALHHRQSLAAVSGRLRGRSGTLAGLSMPRAGGTLYHPLLL